jgi:hypothetical protein
MGMDQEAVLGAEDVMRMRVATRRKKVKTWT